MTTIYHAVEMHHWPPGPDAGRRKRAQESWEPLYALKDMVPVHYTKYVRTAKEIGDTRDLPFLLDVIKPALNLAGANDIVLWSNDDLVFHPQFPDALRRHIAIWGACTSHRCESSRRFMLEDTPDDWCEQSEGHMGRDVFAASGQWLRSYWGHLPDVILGAPSFDLHLAAIVRRQKGYLTTRHNLEQIVPACELPRGYVAHERHQSVWSQLPCHTPSHQHNARLFREWAAVWLPDLAFDHNGNV